MSLLPSNASVFERALESVLARRIEGIEIPLRSLWRPRVCPSGLLPWLAHAVGVERWPDTYSDEQRRVAIESSIEIYRSRGTLSALTRVLSIEGVSYRIVEGVGGAFTFGLEFLSGGVAVPRSRVDYLVDSVRVAKNERSHLVSVSVHHEVDVGVRVGCFVSLESWTEVMFDTWQDHGNEVRGSVGVASRVAQSGCEFNL